MENKTLNRLKTADVLKGLAVLFMIMVHVLEQFADMSVNKSKFGEIVYFLGGPFCAPVFLAVMGYFLAASQSSTIYFLKRGILLYAGGIMLNILRSVHLFIAIFMGRYNLDPWFFVFGADILTLAGLSIIFIALLRLISKDNLFLYSIVMLLFIVSANSITFDDSVTKYISGFIAGNSDHSYFPLFPWFSYVIAGYIFNIIYMRFNDKITKNTYIYLLFISLISIIVIIFSKFAFETTSNLPLYYHHDYRFFGWTIAFMLLYLTLINQIVKLLQNSLFIQYIEWTGKNVTLIYVFQWLIIGNLATALYQTQDILKSLLWFITVTIVSSLLTIAFLKLNQLIKSKNDVLF